jgi:hypothetical protein
MVLKMTVRHLGLRQKFMIFYGEVGFMNLLGMANKNLIKFLTGLAMGALEQPWPNMRP